MMIARSMEATVIVDYRKLFRTGCWPNVLSEIVAQFNYPRPLCSNLSTYLNTRVFIITMLMVMLILMSQHSKLVAYIGLMRRRAVIKLFRVESHFLRMEAMECITLIAI